MVILMLVTLILLKSQLTVGIKDILLIIVEKAMVNVLMLMVLFILVNG